MEAQEIDATLDELESRLDRLRSLYEQYFLGIEKIEPTVARKDVDRRFWLLRKTQIRNTARRFRLQVLVQRYNTFQQHWTRVCREIENGTYVRHLLKVKKNFGEEPKTWAARKRLGLLRKGTGEEPAADETTPEGAGPGAPSDLSGLLTGGDLDAEVLAATAAAFEHAERPRAGRPAQERYSLEDLGPLNLDFEDDPEPTLPPKPVAPAPPVVAAPPPKSATPDPTTRVATSVKIPTFPPPVPIGGPAQKPALPKPGQRPPLPARPAIPGAPKVPTGLAVPRAPAASPPPPAEPFPPAPSSPSSSPPPRPQRPVPAARPAIPGANGARPPGVALSPRVPLPPRDPAAPAMPRPGAPPGARPGPIPGAARPGSPAASGGAPQPRAPVPAAAKPAGPAPNPAAAPRPAVPAAAPVAAKPVGPAPGPTAARPPGAPRDLSDDRLRQLHQELGEAKKKLNLQNNVSLDALSKSLRDTERKLREEHKGRSVDFQVVIKDGKAVVKPIVKK